MYSNAFSDTVFWGVDKAPRTRAECAGRQVAESAAELSAPLAGLLLTSVTTRFAVPGAGAGLGEVEAESAGGVAGRWPLRLWKATI